MNVNYLKEYFRMPQTRDEQVQTVESIVGGIRFKGANLWVLIFAIFIASLGLNVNSTAVIIGAMLISPLMGPIIGMGLAVGITDFDLLKRSLKNYAVATGISVITATVYFTLTPLHEAQSELLARTSPNIYDVLIAFFGGLAGITAICAKDKGNVLPGVAIATALMPPLCTAGYGLANGEWLYFFGAFYLFFINTVFISLATFIGVRALKFQKKAYMDKKREGLIKKYIFLIVAVTIAPSVFMTYSIVKETIFNSSATEFINKELNFPNTQIISKEISYKNKTIKIAIVGDEVSQTMIDNARAHLATYHLKNARLAIIQGINNDSIDISGLQNIVLKDFYETSQKEIREQQNLIESLKGKLEDENRFKALTVELSKEMAVLFPNVKSLSLSNSIKCTIDGDSVATDTICLSTIEFKNKPADTEIAKIEAWMKTRTKSQKLEIIADN